MKKLIALALVLVLVLTLCASAFADYYPTASFTSATKNKLLKYGHNMNMAFKCKQGTGPFNRVWGTISAGKKGWIWRADITVNAKKGTFSKKIADYDFTGNPTIKHKLKTKTTFSKPKKGKIDTYKLTLTSWYRPTVNYQVYNFKSYKSVKTNLYVYR